jgi:hypothetical protein
MTTHKEETIKVRGRNTRLFRGGEGPPLLFLHDTFCPLWLPIHQILAEHYEVFVPLHPGCAGSEDGFAQFEEMEDVDTLPISVNHHPNPVWRRVFWPLVRC